MSALHNISYGVYVLSAKTDKANACIINTLVQLTSSPKQVAITVNKTNHTTQQIQKSGVFTVSVLDTTTPFDLIKHFGFQSGKDVNKFKSFKDFALAENGLPYITVSTNAYISATVIKSIDVGTHIMFIAEVTEEKVLAETAPLTYADYITKVKPATKVKKGAWVCKVCGFVYMGETLPEDYICPICKHPASDFEWKEEN